jgi:hypothetical protein
MTKTNNNKLKVLIFFFIGLGSTNQTMEDNYNHKRTHSQRQNNQDDEITQIDTTSTQKIRFDNPNQINTVSTNIPNQPVFGFVHKLVEADMGQDTLYIGPFHNASYLFPIEHTIGQDATSVQLIDPNIFYKINDKNLEKGQVLGPFVNPGIVTLANEKDLHEKTPSVNFERLRKFVMESIEQDIKNNADNRDDFFCLRYSLKKKDYGAILQLLMKKIKDASDGFFEQMFGWMKGEPTQDLSQIQETHASNLFEDLTQDFLFHVRYSARVLIEVESIVIDEEKDFFSIVLPDNKTIDSSINDGLMKIFFNTLFNDLPSRINNMRNLLFSFKSTKQVFNRIPNSELYRHRKSKITQKKYNDISAEISHLSMQVDITGKNLDQLKKSLKKIVRVQKISPLSLMYNLLYKKTDHNPNRSEVIKIIRKTLNLTNIKKGLNPIEKNSYKIIKKKPIISNKNWIKKKNKIGRQGIYQNLRSHFSLKDYPYKPILFKVKKEEQPITSLLGESDKLFRALVSPSKVAEINILQELKRHGISSKPDKIFIDERHNEWLKKIMESFKSNDYIDCLFKTLEELKICSIEGENKKISYLTRFFDSALYQTHPAPSFRRIFKFNNPKVLDPYRANLYLPYLHSAYEDPSEDFNDGLMPLYSHRNLKTDILNSTKLYLSMAEDQSFLNLENSLLELPITDPEFFKKFMTTFYETYGKTLIAYAQYNVENNFYSETSRNIDLENPEHDQFRLAMRGYLRWLFIINEIRPKLLKKYPLAFSYDKSVDEKTSSDQLKQAHGEFLFQILPLLLRTLFYNFSETDYTEECFGIGAKDQFNFRSLSLLIEIILRQMSKTIKKVVYLPNELGILPSNEESIPQDKLFEATFKNFPLKSKILDQVYTEALGKSCNFNNKEQIKYVDNLINLLFYDHEAFSWFREPTHVDIDLYDRFDYQPEKRTTSTVQRLIIIDSFKHLLKKTIANGLSGQDDNQGTVTIYTTDWVVNGVFGLEPRPMATIIRDFGLGNIVGSQEWLEQAEFNYRLATTTSLDISRIFQLKNSQFKFQHHYSKMFKYLQVVFQGYNQRKKGKLLKLQNPNDQRIQRMAIPPKMFNNITNTFIETNGYVFHMPRQLMHFLMGVIKEQHGNKRK